MIPNPNATGRTRLLGIALLVATFVAGGFSGAALERRASAEPAMLKRQEKAQSSERDDEQPQKRRRSIFDQIDLAPEQRAAIDSILQAGREKVDAYWKQTEPGYRALLDSTRAQVRAVMTPEQLAEYDRLRAEHRARVRAEGENGGGKGNGSGGKSVSSGTDFRGAGGVGWSRSIVERRAGSKETRAE